MFLYVDTYVSFCKLSCSVSLTNNRFSMQRYLYQTWNKKECVRVRLFFVFAVIPYQMIACCHPLLLPSVVDQTAQESAFHRNPSSQWGHRVVPLVCCCSGGTWQTGTDWPTGQRWALQSITVLLMYVKLCIVTTLIQLSCMFLKHMSFIIS